MITRTAKNSLEKLASYYPVVSVTGPRQSGKSTLVKATFPNYKYINLEDVTTFKRADDDPTGFIKNLKKPAIIDEAQLVPEIFSQIMLYVDEHQQNGKFILTGSQNFLLLKQISQSLAGRVGLLKLLPLSYNEIKQFNNKVDYIDTIINGGYPRLFVNEIPADIYYEDLINTYIERDIKGFQSVRDTNTFYILIRLLAQHPGQILNYNRIANDLNITYKTVRDWINMLIASYIIYLVPPYSTNIRKQITKSPKVYFYDTGLVCHFQNINNTNSLINDSNFGHIFENFVFNEKIKDITNKLKKNNLAFYRNKYKQEIDMIDSSSKDYLIATEIKSGATLKDEHIKTLQNSENLLNFKNIHKKFLYRGEESFRYKEIDVINIEDFLKSLT